jgi:F-type H+-transporting ATPase subunit epsilon
MAIELGIVTPRGVVFQGPVDDVVLPGVEGEFGVLTGHERFLTSVDIGELTIHSPAETVYAAISEGFAEVNGDRVTVLVDSCEIAAEIDVARAERARARAEQNLAELERDEDERRYAEYEVALRMAETRVAVSERAGS